MRNKIPAISGFLLMVLWLVGLGSNDARTWLSWLDGVGGLAAFVVGAMMATSVTDQGRKVPPLLLSAFLIAIGLVGVTTAGPVWQGWWTFAFGSAFLILGISAGSASAEMDEFRINSTYDLFEKDREKEGRSKKSA